MDLNDGIYIPQVPHRTDNLLWFVFTGRWIYRNPDKRPWYCSQCDLRARMQSNSGERKKHHRPNGSWWKFIYVDCIHAAFEPLTMWKIKPRPMMPLVVDVAVSTDISFVAAAAVPNHKTMSFPILFESRWFQCRHWFYWRIASKPKPKPLPLDNINDDNLLLGFVMRLVLNVLIHHFIIKKGKSINFFLPLLHRIV